MHHRIPASVLAALLATLLTCGASHAASAPTDSELSRSALAGYLHDTRPSVVDSAIAEGRRTLSKKAQQDGLAAISATLIFNEGLATGVLAALCAKYDLELIRAELKVPTGEDQQVFTISIGPDDLLRFDGPLAQRLRRAIGHARLEFLELSKVAQGAEAEMFRRVAYSQRMLMYRAQFIGTAVRLDELANDSVVLAAFAEDSRAHIEGYRDLKRRRSEARVGAPVTTRSATS